MRDPHSQVLVIHGAGEPLKRHGEIYWKPMLEKTLGPGFEVHAPRMPAPEDPHHEAWANCIAEQVSRLQQPFLVGHSLGASTLLKFLAQADPKPAFRGLFLISTPFWGSDFPEYALTAEDCRQLESLRPVFFYQGKDDDVVEPAHFERYRRALPHAAFRLLEGRGHGFEQEEFPELGDDIRSLVAIK